MAAPEAACWGGSVSATKSQDTCLDGAMTTGAAAAGIPAVASAASKCAKPAGEVFQRRALRGVRWRGRFLVQIDQIDLYCQIV